MMPNVLIVDDDPEHLRKFGESFRLQGCSILSIGDAAVEKRKAEILGFRPDLAIVDSRFEGNDLEGLSIIRRLQEMVPRVPIVVCSILADEGAARRRWFESKYREAPHVCGTLGKNPFPSAAELLAYIETNRSAMGE